MQVTSYESPCHFIFEKSTCNFYVTTHDVNFEVDAVSRQVNNIPKQTKRTIVDHDEYISCIQAYVKQGWDLAGMIHMENRSKPITYGTNKGARNKTKSRNEMFWSTIKLIFQSPAGEDSSGGLL